MPSKRVEGEWLASVPIVVSDKAISRNWYTEKRGLELTADEYHWVAVGDKSKGSAIHLCLASENQPQPIPMEPGPWGYILAIPGDFELECKHLKEKGVEFTPDPEGGP